MTNKITEHKVNDITIHVKSGGYIVMVQGDDVIALTRNELAAINNLVKEPIREG